MTGKPKIVKNMTKDKHFAPYDRINRFLLPIVPKKLRPNHLTFFRLIVSPVLIILLAGHQYLYSLILFVVLAVTDMLDGSLARLRNQITDWGKIWDPVADKVLIGIVVVMLLLEVNLALTVLLVAFEMAFILGGSFIRMKMKDVEISANVWGKIKMNLQCLGAVFLMLGAILSWNLFIPLAQVFLYLSLFFAALSMLRKGI